MAHLHRKIDSVGTCLSLLCAVHCIALPILILLIPSFGFLMAENYERIFVAGTICLALFSLVLGAISHRQAKPFYFFGIAVASILFAETYGEESFMHRVFFLVGAVFLATTHIINRRLCTAQAGETLVKIGRSSNVHQ